MTVASRAPAPADSPGNDPVPGKVTLALNSIHRTFHQGGNSLEVLRGASLALNRGETVALVGPSGAGKSTLLHIAGLLERPDGGEVLVNGVAAENLSDRERTRMRRSTLGFVYQYHHLLPEFSAVENVMLPQVIAGVSRRAARKHAMALLERFGLEARAQHRPARLSGGEQQRTAIARAIANRPQVLLADEPTGNLDSKTADIVFDELLALVRGSDLCALIATHNEALAARMDRTVVLADGVLVEN